jgi:hypothetical protein
MNEHATATTRPSARRPPIAVRAAVAAVIVTAIYRLRQRRRVAAASEATR